MDSVSVVIPHYFREREPNLRRIVDALAAGTVRPAEIIVWANEPLAEPLPGAAVIGSHRNIGAQARFLAALAASGEWVLFLDNDVSPAPRTVENLLHWARPDRIVTLEGRSAGGKTYRESPKHYGRDVSEPLLVAVSLGRGEMVSRRALPRLLAHFPFAPDTVMDDLWLSAAAGREGMPILVVPAVAGDSDLVNLPEYGVGLSLRPEFYAERDAALAAIAGAGARRDWDSHMAAWAERVREFGPVRASGNASRKTPEQIAEFDRVQRSAVMPALRAALRPGDAPTLDFGCGTGRWSEALAAECGSCVAVDPTPEILAVAKATPRVRFAPMVDGQIPLPDASVGVVFSCLVLNAIVLPAMLTGTVREFARVLRAGGLLFVVDLTTRPGPALGRWSVARSVDEYRIAFAGVAPLSVVGEYLDGIETHSIMVGRKRATA